MEAFMHQGRFVDPTSEIAFEWRTESSNYVGKVSIHMKAIGRDSHALITAVFSDEEVHRYGNDACVLEAMARAERELTIVRPTKRENTRGVLRHLVQMARTVAA
jgi:hypothetical protein